MPVQALPDVDVPILVVTVPYLGAAPEEVESGVCARLEESVVGILGIREIRSISDEGVCTVQLQLYFDADPAEVLGEVEAQINAIDTFPDETERPIVRVVTFANVVAEVAVTGPSDERTLKELGRRVRDDLLRQPGIAQARVVNSRPYEISVEVSQAALLGNQLTFDDVAAAIRQRSVDLPGGAIRTDQRELLVRTSGQAYTGRELGELVLTARDDGTRVLLKDVARMVDGFADSSQGLRFDARPAALVQIVRVGNQDLREVAAAVRQYVAESGSRYPDGVELTLWNDESTLLSDRIGALADNALQGLLLVLVLLALFLRPHLAVWVAAGIPIAFLGAIFLVYWLGYSIDSISVIGFILALGMLVDDAVVVGESVFAAHRDGAGQLSGAIRGCAARRAPGDVRRAYDRRGLRAAAFRRRRCRRGPRCDVRRCPLLPGMVADRMHHGAPGTPRPSQPADAAWRVRRDVPGGGGPGRHDRDARPAFRNRGGGGCRHAGLRGTRPRRAAQARDGLRAHAGSVRVGVGAIS